MASETGTRLVVALVAIPLVVGVVYLGGWALAALLAVAAVLGALEFYRMAALKGAAPLRWLGAAGAALFALHACFGVHGGPDHARFGTLVVLLLLASAVAAIWMRGVEGQPLLSVSTTVVGAVYTGATLSFALFLRHLPGVRGPWDGTALVFAPVLLTWASDTFAYFAGRAWGTRKLIPRVSPGKTVQGAVGALVGSMLVAVAYFRFLPILPEYRLGPVAALLFGLLISVAAQVGDLVESLLKRDAGVKDSGTLLPGHGGALDRLDSLLFTLPVAYLLLRYLAAFGGGL